MIDETIVVKKEIYLNLMVTVANRAKELQAILDSGQAYGPEVETPLKYLKSLLHEAQQALV